MYRAASYIGENEIPAVDGGPKHDTPTRVPGLGVCLRATAEDLVSNPGSYRVRRVTLPRRCPTASNVTECSCCGRRPIHRCFAVVGPSLEHPLACSGWEAANSSSSLEAIAATRPGWSIAGTETNILNEYIVVVYPTSQCRPRHPRAEQYNSRNIPEIESQAM